MADARSRVIERRVLWFLVGLTAYHVLARVSWADEVLDRSRL